MNTTKTDVPKIHFTLEEVIKDSIDLALQIYQDLDNSKEANIVYIKNGGTFPGEVVSYVLRQLNVNVSTYGPHYGRYGTSTVGGEIKKVKDLPQEQLDVLSNNIKNEVPTYFLDELIDEGDTFVEVNNDLMSKLELTKDQFYGTVKGAALHFKPNYFLNHVGDELSKFVNFGVTSFKDENPEMWLIYPWEKGHDKYDKNLASLIYEKPIKELRRWIYKHVAPYLKEILPPSTSPP